MAADIELLRPCGTRPGYRRHLDQHEPPCGPCNQANASVTARSRDRAKAQARLRAELQARVDRDIRQLVHVLACALGAGRQL